MDARHSMKARLFFESKREAEIVLQSVQPDFTRKFERSESVLSCKNEMLELSIAATDLTAMRASFNSTMKGIVISGKILNDLQVKK